MLGGIVGAYSLYWDCRYQRWIECDTGGEERCEEYGVWEFL